MWPAYQSSNQAKVYQSMFEPNIVAAIHPQRCITVPTKIKISHYYRQIEGRNVLMFRYVLMNTSLGTGPATTTVSPYRYMSKTRLFKDFGRHAHEA